MQQMKISRTNTNPSNQSRHQLELASPLSAANSVKGAPFYTIITACIILPILCSATLARIVGEDEAVVFAVILPLGILIGIMYTLRKARESFARNTGTLMTWHYLRRIDAQNAEILAELKKLNAAISSEK